MNKDEKAFTERLRTARAEMDRIATPVVAETDQQISELLGDAEDQSDDAPKND